MVPILSHTEATLPGSFVSPSIPSSHFLTPEGKLPVPSHPIQDAYQAATPQPLQDDHHPLLTFAQLVLRLPTGNGLDAPLDSTGAPA